LHCNPWYASKYYCNYRVGKWSSHTKEVSHLFSCHTQKQIDIVIIRNNFWTLANVVIVDPIHTNLVQHALTTTHVTTVATQKNKASARRWFHSPCHKDLWLSPSSLFLFYLLCTCQYSLLPTNLLGTCNAYILL
jgi:hypothetical protein